MAIGKVGFFVLLSIGSAAAQGVGIGVKGGAPFTDMLQATRISQTFQATTKRFTVGPMLDIRLPFGLGVEFDALYKRFDQTGNSINGGTSAKTGSSWEFPLLGKYRFGRSLAKPYVEAGISFNHLSGYLLPFRSPDVLVGQPTPVSQQPEGSTTRTGFTVGAGIEFKLAVVRISPGIRFSHWSDQLFVPSANAADFLVGVSF
jgi:opacity protein-like surface antigen